MSTPVEPGRLLHLYPLSEPQPFAVPYGGLQYMGEVVLSERWDPEWGRTLGGDLYFRIVLLRNRRHFPSSDIQDSRIAVCIPGRRPSRGRAQVGRELTALRETQALYLTRRDPDTTFLRNYLERQREELESQLASEEAALYAGGHIESPSVVSEDMGEYFAGPDPALWFQRLARGLLSWAYPALPLDPSLLPGPLTPDDVPKIYEAIFASDTQGRAAMEEFGPGLGLSDPHAPSAFSPGECKVFGQILAELDSGRGELIWKDIHLLLAHATGLTQSLATLYLFAFVYYGQPETELVLTSGHSLAFRDSRPVRGSRLTREFIPFLPWHLDLFAQDIVGLRLLRPEVSWNDALQYTSLLCQGLTEVEEGYPDVSTQEQALLDSLRQLAEDTRHAHEVLESLSRTIPSPNKGALLSAIQLLSEVCEGGDYPRVYELARRDYVSPEELIQEIALLRRMVYFEESQGEIVGMKDYLDGAVVQAGYEELSFNRTALLEELSLPVILASDDQGWPTVRARVRDYQARYSRAYADHHSDYQREVLRLREFLEDAGLKFHALTLLNSIAELGEPVGPELEQLYEGLDHGIWRCDVNPGDIPLQINPRCPNCLMALGEEPPTEVLRLFLRDLERALGEQNRRLSLLLVERILQDGIDQRLENFLKIVRSSDLSALSNTLNPELVAFISHLLRNP